MEIEKIEDKEGYTQCDCAGDYSTDEFIEILNKAILHSIQRKRKAVLINVSAVKSHPLDTLERYTIGERIAIAQRSHSEIVTIAVVGNVPLIDPNKFAETVALNRGAAGKAFFDLEEAMAWIAALDGNKGE
jgi:hypothetical protein